MSSRFVFDACEPFSSLAQKGTKTKFKRILPKINPKGNFYANLTLSIMLRTAIHQIIASSHSTVVPKLCSSFAMAASARYANSTTRYWLSTKTKKSKTKKESTKLSDKEFMMDHSFDENEEMEKASHVVEEASHKKAKPRPFIPEEPNEEELLAKNEFIRDHTFEVNKDSKKTK